MSTSAFPITCLRPSLAFELDDPDRVDVPSELAKALADNDTLREVWDGLTAGRKRGLCYRVESARKTETRLRRVDEVLEELRRLDFS